MPDIFDNLEFAQKIFLKEQYSKILEELNLHKTRGQIVRRLRSEGYKLEEAGTLYQSIIENQEKTILLVENLKKEITEQETKQEEELRQQQKEYDRQREKSLKEFESRAKKYKEDEQKGNGNGTERRENVSLRSEL